MNKINTVIIPIAGKGTRFLPVTKTITKTMFPIINKPVLHYLLEEALNAGLTNVILVISDEQNIIKDYLDVNSCYYDNLTQNYPELECLKSILNQINITYVTQDKPRGLGDAINLCRNLIIDEGFGVMLGDDFVMSNDTTYGIYDLVKEYNSFPANYIGIKEVKEEDTHKYGIVKLDNKRIIDMIEKPKYNAPSRFAAVGRYVFNTSIFDYLNNIIDDGVHEMQLTDAIVEAIKKENVFGINFNGYRFDIGDHTGYVLANIYASLQDKKIKDKVVEFIRTI